MKLLIIPVHLGDYYHPEDNERFFENLKKITRRSNIFLDIKNQLHVFIPKNIDEKIHGLTHALEEGMFSTKDLLIHEFDYADIENNGASEENKFETKRFGTVVGRMPKYMQQVAIVINSVHLPGFLNLFRNVKGYAEKTNFSFFGIAGVGNTESFIFDNKDPNSVEHLRFHKHLDFFLPKDVCKITPKVVMLARGVHEKIKQAGGQEEYLKQLAETIL